MFTVYSKPGCPACDNAKALLQSKQLDYEEIVLDIGQEKDPSKRYSTIEYLKKLVPSARTVPQIFKDGVLVGGFDSLKMHLER